MRRAFGSNLIGATPPTEELLMANSPQNNDRNKNQTGQGQGGQGQGQQNQGQRDTGQQGSGQNQANRQPGGPDADRMNRKDGSKESSK
jgi:hypothetical protein